MSAYPRPAGVRPHILVVNGRKVRQPVFLLGAPCSGVSILARALKRSEGFHLTMGQRWVLPVVHAFARNPLLARGRAEAAATVLRDAFAQGWQVSPHCCLGCSAECRAAAGAEGTGPCVGDRAISRYGDASPDLLYCAESLVDAFPDARLVQIIRDGRDVVAGMISDADALAWFRPGFVDLDAESAHPVLGLETQADRAGWPSLSLAGKCAMRWRGTVRLMARLRNALSAEQLITLRYEDMIRQPLTTARAVSSFTGAEVSHLELRPGPETDWEAGVWRRLLSPAQAAEVERVAGGELRRVGYGTCPVETGACRVSWLANWVWYSSAYSPPAASSSSCRPRSLTWPWSITRIWSASRIVDSRCAITREVRPASAVFSARWTATSDSESRWAVASSSTTTDGALSSSRAIASRCFSPPESR